MMPTAPEAIALSMKRLPSVEPPFMATKTEPGRTRRESYSMPVMSRSESPDAPTASTSAMRSFHFISCSIVDGVRRSQQVSCDQGQERLDTNDEDLSLEVNQRDPRTT